MRVTHIAVTYGETKSLPATIGDEKPGHIRAGLTVGVDVEELSVEEAEARISELQKQIHVDVMRAIDRGLRMRTGPEVEETPA